MKRKRKKPSVKDYTNNLPYLLYGFLASRLSRLFVGDEKQDFDNGKRQTLLAAEKAKKNKLSISVRWIEKATRDPRDQNHENRVFTLENSQQSPSTSTSLSAHSLAILTKQISLISREWNWESKRQWPTKTPQRDKRLIIKMKTMLLLSFSLPSLACLRKTFYAIIGKRKTLWWICSWLHIYRDLDGCKQKNDAANCLARFIINSHFTDLIEFSSPKRILRRKRLCCRLSFSSELPDDVDCCFAHLPAFVGELLSFCLRQKSILSHFSHAEDLVGALRQIESASREI